MPHITPTIEKGCLPKTPRVRAWCPLRPITLRPRVDNRRYPQHLGLRRAKITASGHSGLRPYDSQFRAPNISKSKYRMLIEDAITLGRKEGSSSVP